MKEKEYEIFEFRFIDKKSKDIISIYASTQDNAELILDVINECNEKQYERKKIGFKKKVIVNIEPKTLEMQQRDTEEQNLVFRTQNNK